MSGEGVIPAAPEGVGAPHGTPIAGSPFTPAQEARLYELWRSWCGPSLLDLIGSKKSKDGSAYVIRASESVVAQLDATTENIIGLLVGPNAEVCPSRRRCRR